MEFPVSTGINEDTQVFHMGSWFKLITINLNFCITWFKFITTFFLYIHHWFISMSEN